MAANDEPLAPVPLSGLPVISLRQAAIRANLSPDSMSRWVRRYGLGRRLSPTSPWRISAPALEMVLACDFDALEILRAGRIDDETLKPYLDLEAA